MKRLLYSFALSLLTGSAVWGQQFSCATTHYHNQLVQEDPTILKDLEKLIANAMVTKSGDDSTTVFVIPVVFHIIHQNGPENISDAQVFDAMEVLNRDYRKLNADTATVIPIYQPLIGDAKIEFKLAAYDPWGNCTNGIDRLYSHETTIGDAYCKLNQWDRSKYLNIWVVRSMEGGTAGYAHYPTDVNGLGYWRDGIVLRHNYIGRTNTPAGWTGSDYASRALTHEVGHWLALPHVWGSTNDPGVGCGGSDGIDDTPETMGHTACTNLYPITCDKRDFTNAVYTFNNTTTTSGTTDTTAAPNQVILNQTRIEFSDFKAVGTSANSTQDGVFSFANWGTGATDGETVYANLTGTVALGKYYEFTLTPQEMQGMNFTYLNFRVGRNATGARTFVVRSSADNFATNLPVAIAPTTPVLSTQTGNVIFFSNDVDTSVVGARVNLNVNPVTASFSNVYTPRTFRIYAYNAEDAAGTFSVDNVTVNGTYGTIENIQNYMEYSYCSHMFTLGQVAVMRHALQSSDGQRKNLITAATHEATGIDLTTPPVCIPTPDIKSNRLQACVGNTVQFTDQSFNGPVTFREWVFEDATPATSTAANPSVVFNSTGLKTVTITVGNASGQATKTFQQFIDVVSQGAAYTGPASFDLEPELQYQELRFINDGNNYSKFEPVNIGYNSNRSLKLTTYKDISGALPGTFESFYYQSLGGQVDEIITPAFDLRHTTGINFSFDYSYATNAVQATSMTEEIQVLYSKNCGETWMPMGSTTQSTIKGATLAVAGFAGNIDFNPASSSDWGTFSRPYTPNSGDNLTRFKIRFTASDYSNNLFIDNIRITGTLGLQDDFSSEHELIISPNPVVSGNDLNIQYVAGNEPVTFILRNLQGEEITSVVRNEMNQAVSFGFEISENIAAAYYFLEVKSVSGTTVKKIAVIK